MRFLSVGPEICLQLPSDSTSQWTPLLFGYTFPTTWACSGLTPVRARPWRANAKRPTTFQLLTFPVLDLLLRILPHQFRVLRCRISGYPNPPYLFSLNVYSQKNSVTPSASPPPQTFRPPHGRRRSIMSGRCPRTEPPRPYQPSSSFCMTG